MTTPKVTVEYNGGYPNLCSGTLRVWVDDVQVPMGEYGLDDEGSFDNGLSSGGGLDGEYIPYSGEWQVEIYEPWLQSFHFKVLCAKYKMPPSTMERYLKREIAAAIPNGCCGGCA